MAHAHARTETTKKSGPLLLLRTNSPGQQQNWTTYHEILHGLLSHKNRGIPMKIKFGDAPMAPWRHFLLFFVQVFFLNRGKGLARLLKLYMVFLQSKKEITSWAEQSHTRVFLLVFLYFPNHIFKVHFPLKVIFHWRISSIEGHLPLKVIFHSRSSSIEGCFPSKFVCPLKFMFHWRSSSIEGCLSLKVVFHWSSFSIEGHPPLKVVFYWRSSSIEGRLLLNVVFYWRLSSIEIVLHWSVCFSQISISSKFG